VPDFVTGLPKCELHVHLEGTLEEEMAHVLGARHGLGTGADARPATFDGLSAFLHEYYAAMEGLRDEADFHDLTAAYLATARAQGVQYAEMFFDPQAHTSRGVPFDAVVTGIHRAQEEARNGAGPESALVMCFLRDESVESAEATLADSLPYRDWIVGVGLDSDERGNPPVKFADVFARARAAGYRLTLHCDVRQEDSVAHMWQCLDVIGVERIDHGLECVADGRLCDVLAERGVGLTACPLSNLRLYGDTMGSVVRELLQRGILVSVNSDDPAYFGGYVADNFRALAERDGFTRDELVLLARNSWKISWLPPARRDGFLGKVDAYAAAA
jgi:adenine deaminase